MDLEEKLKRNFAVNLSRLREQHKLTQAGLADAVNARYDLGLKRTALANYEAREALPKLSTLSCLAGFFGRTIDELLADELPDRPAKPPLERTITAELLKDYADQMMIRQFFVVFCQDLLEEMKKNLPGLQDPEEVARLFNERYLHHLLGRSRTFQERLHAVLTPDEEAVFRAIQEGLSFSRLVEIRRQHETEDDLIRLFHSAQAKISRSIADF
jgi:transcriptional regulator with XRE-family HTH domain